MVNIYWFLDNFILYNILLKISIVLKNQLCYHVQFKNLMIREQDKKDNL